MKKILLLFAAILIMTGMTVCRTDADDNTRTVTVRIEGKSETYYYDTVTTGETTVFGLMEEISAGNDNLKIHTESGSYGSYITGINEDMAGSIGPEYYDGWMYIVNGISPSVGMDQQEINDGDSIVLYYSDEFGSHGFAVPVIDLSGINAGVINFTYNGYDDDYNIVKLPVEEAEVTFDNKTYITDDEGNIVIDQEMLTKGVHSLAISKVSEDGMPLVLRLPDDYTVEITGEDAEETDTGAGDGRMTGAYMLLACISFCVIILSVRKKGIYE